MYHLGKVLFISLAISCTIGCSDINDSWEVNGGGYLKYTFNGGKSYTIELAKDDVRRPDYGRSYFQVNTRAKESKKGDQFSIVVNRPILGENTPESGYTWMIAEKSIKGYLTGDSNVVIFDQKDDSTWTADVDLHFSDCRSGNCNDSIPIHIKGRLRYWVAMDDR